jgi:hypothetical protein
LISILGFTRIAKYNAGENQNVVILVLSGRESRKRKKGEKYEEYVHCF